MRGKPPIFIGSEASIIVNPRGRRSRAWLVERVAALSADHQSLNDARRPRTPRRMDFIGLHPLSSERESFLTDKRWYGNPNPVFCRAFVVCAVARRYATAQLYGPRDPLARRDRCFAAASGALVGRIAEHAPYRPSLPAAEALMCSLRQQHRRRRPTVRQPSSGASDRLRRH